MLCICATKYWGLFLFNINNFQLTAPILSFLHLFQSNCTNFRPTAIISSSLHLFQATRNYFLQYVPISGQLVVFHANCTFFELIASTSSKLKLFRLHLQVVNCADFIQLYEINYLEQIAIIYSKPQLFGAIYTISSQLYQFHA